MRKIIISLVTIGLLSLSMSVVSDSAFAGCHCKFSKIAKYLKGLDKKYAVSWVQTDADYLGIEFYSYTAKKDKYTWFQWWIDEVFVGYDGCEVGSADYKYGKFDGYNWKDKGITRFMTSGGVDSVDCATQIQEALDILDL